jgi:phosphoglycerate dehydrogenase-like enzyme
MLSLIERLRNQGKAIVIVSHNLLHVFRVADTITVLRGGRVVGSRRKSQTTADEIAISPGMTSPWCRGTGTRRHLNQTQSRRTMKKKILCNIQQIYGRPATYLQPLRDAGFEIVMNEKGRLLTEDELIERMLGVYATVAGGEPYTDRVFERSPDLKVVARFGVGWDKVDVDAATRRGIAVAMAFGTNHESVADGAMALALALSVNLLGLHRFVAQGGWGAGIHAGLWGRTMGIVGLGRIGRAVARRAQAFAMRVLAYDSAPERDYARDNDIELVSLDRLLAEADIVSLHTPILPQTRNIIGARELGLMKPTAFIINTARGGLIDETALYKALVERRIAGAGLDVFAKEPPQGSPLLILDNVILTPHAIGMDEAAERLMAERCVSNILAIHSGRDPGIDFVLNPQVLAAKGATHV